MNVPRLLHKGKVRDVYELGFNRLALFQSNRLSVFDRHACEVPQKGRVLTELSKWWFERTGSIMPNHFLGSEGNYMFSKQCQPIKLEMVIRAYMTGTTETSILTAYNRGDREYCGHSLREGYKVNEPLDEPIVTPTTKGDKDIPISGLEAIKTGLCTKDEWEFLEHKSLELFKHGQDVASSRGMILADTKLEFGRCLDTGKILLMDELFTCDSSRFWESSSYEDQLRLGKGPKNFDKDVIRSYVRGTGCDPYKDVMPVIPDDLISKTQDVYLDFYKRLTGNKLDKQNDTDIIYEADLGELFEKNKYEVLKKMVLIYSGSEADEWHIKKIQEKMAEHGIWTDVHYLSAHKKPRQLLSKLDEYHVLADEKDLKIMNVAVAGMSSALGAVIAANNRFATISCPPYKDLTDMTTNVQSTLQNPSKVPVAVILSPGNVAHFCDNVFKTML